MPFRKTVATFVLGATLGGVVMYGLKDNLQQAVHRVPVEQRCVINYKASTPFLEIVQSGKRLQLYQGKEGPVFCPEYVVSSTQSADLEKIVKNGLGILPEEKQLGITVYGLKELEEGNRAAAIETGLDYCKPETKARVITTGIHELMKNGYVSVLKKLQEIDNWIGDKLTGGAENGGN